MKAMILSFRVKIDYLVLIVDQNTLVFKLAMKRTSSLAGYLPTFLWTGRLNRLSNSVTCLVTSSSLGATYLTVLGSIRAVEMFRSYI